MNRQPADGTTCACHPGHRCRPCGRRARIRLRLVIHSWSDNPESAAARHQREVLSHEEQVNRRDSAWTARDAASIYVDRDKCPHTWWELRWPDYWQRQGIVRESHPAPSAEDIQGWADHNGHDIHLMDAFPLWLNTRACTATLTVCDEATFIFRRHLAGIGLNMHPGRILHFHPTSIAAGEAALEPNPLALFARHAS